MPLLDASGISNRYPNRTPGTITQPARKASIQPAGADINKTHVQFGESPSKPVKTGFLNAIGDFFKRLWAQTIVRTFTYLKGFFTKEKKETQMEKPDEQQAETLAEKLDEPVTPPKSSKFEELPYTISGRTYWAVSSPALEELDNTISKRAESYVQPGDTIFELSYHGLSQMDRRTTEEIAQGAPVNTFASQATMEKADTEDLNLQKLLVKYREDLENLEAFGKEQFEAEFAQAAKKFEQENPESDNLDNHPDLYPKVKNRIENKIKVIETAMPQRKAARLSALESAESFMNGSRSKNFRTSAWSTDDKAKALDKINQLFKDII